MLHRFLNLDTGDFVGRSATIDRQAKGAEVKCVYLQIDAIDADVYGGETVFCESTGDAIGVVTSGAYGHTVEESLAFAYIDASVADKGSELAVEILGEKCKALILSEPLWDPQNKRQRNP